MNRGNAYAIGAYLIWGLFPVYFRWLREVPALQLTSHRIVWSFVVLLALVLALRRWRTFRTEAMQGRVLLIYSIAAVLLGINWLTFVWAVNSGFIVESSLGYFINPLMSVLLGVVFLHERLRRWQWAAIALAAAGVLYMTLAYGRLPWIALTLATSFALYGFVKKKAYLGTVSGLTLETAILFVPALFYLFHAEAVGTGAFLHAGGLADLLMIAAGPVTTLPLILFAAAAKRIPLSMMGIFQYMTPTLQFLLGVLVYGEAFSHIQLVGFGAVWTALLIFGADGFFNYRRSRGARNGALGGPTGAR